jgi:tetratricopeptide (TPR) repeat protein
MQGPPSRQPGKSSWPPPATSLDAKIEDAERVVDSMLASFARGRLDEDAWDRLFAAATRDACIDEIASAFVNVARGPRIKTVPPSVAADFHFQAARFFDEVLGDDLGAAMHLERSLAIAPGHADSFSKMEAILGKRDRCSKVAEMYCAAAPHRPRGQQALMLRRAIDLLARAAHESVDESDGADTADERLVDLWQRILRLEPGDDEARSQLEALYVKSGRFREAVRLNDQSLARDPAPDEYLRAMILERIIVLYADKLDEPERAIGHVEQLLLLDPTHEVARRVAERLLAVKGLAGRAGAALANAYEVQGTPQDVARCLSVELESAHGARRIQVLTRLGKLKEEHLGDDAGALEAYEQALGMDATDSDLRDHYIGVAMRLGRHADAAKMLERIIASATDPSVEARARAQLGETLVGRGETKRAKALLLELLESRAPADARLRAARTLRAIHEAAYDRRALCDVLDRLATLEVDEDARREANERLAAVASKNRDTPRAIEANERLLSTSSRAAALEALAGLYRGSGQREKYARTLDAQARDATSPEQARALLMRAAQVRAREMKDAGAAIATYQNVLERFGQQRDALALLLPLLEAEGRWADVAEVLTQDAALAHRSERPPIFARLGLVRWSHLKKTASAVEAFAQALFIDERERTARASLEKIIAEARDDERAEIRAKLGPLWDGLEAAESCKT